MYIETSIRETSTRCYLETVLSVNRSNIRGPLGFVTGFVREICNMRIISRKNNYEIKNHTRPSELADLVRVSAALL